MKNIYKSNVYSCENVSFLRKGSNFSFLAKAAFLLILLLCSFSNLFAQSAPWDSWGQNGTAGNNDYGNGVIRLLSDVNTGCAGSAVHETSSKYDPTLGNFSACYQVFFGCPGNDNIGPVGSDLNGDGMAFSFSKCGYNINNGLACGGGLGYMGSCAQMITVEFDTWSSMGNSNFDNIYGGGTSGNHDEIAIHKDGDASFAGRITSVDAGNLEDGLEHAVCITYNRTTHILGVTIDAITILTYDLTGSPYELSTYFGAGGLNQTWSSGKAGATNPSTVTAGANIVANLGGVPLCPAGVDITSPSDGAIFYGCPVGPIAITATANPPAGNTVTYVEFFVNGASIGSDFTANYGATWATPTMGNHALTAIAHWSGGSTTTSPANTINVGGVQKTSTAPVINGGVDALWSSYSATSVLKANGAVSPDLAATYRINYDASNLYILVDVTDDVLVRNGTGATWEDDGVEIYIDFGNDKAGAYGLNDYQYTFNWNSAAIIETKHGATGGVALGQANRAGGYIMEISIPWSTIGGVPVAGTRMGFDVGVNDDDDGGTRDNQLSWNDATFGEWNNTLLFGTIQFSSCDPLPVKLITFTGRKTNEVVVLNWTTAVEINSHKFVVERSGDLSHWITIGEVAGAGNSNAMIHYNLTDNNPLHGTAYYRLRQVDMDGAFVYSNSVTIETEGQSIYMSIMPNPFDGELTIQSNIIGEEMDITIFDVLGKVMYHTHLKSDNGMLGIQPELPTGTYIITVATETFVQQQKIIKK